MRKFRTTVIILGAGMLASKFMIGATASPLENNWGGPVYVTTSGEKKTGVELNIRKYRTDLKTGTAQSMVMRFSGSQAAMASLGVTDEPIACGIRDELEIRNGVFPKVFELTNLQYARAGYKINSSLCRRIGIKHDSIGNELTVAFDGLPMIAKVRKDNDRGFIANYYQNSNLSEWMAGK